jgi:hypothetical protein
MKGWMAHSDGADRKARKPNEQGHAASGRLREPTLLNRGQGTRQGAHR